LEFSEQDQERIFGLRPSCNKTEVSDKIIGYRHSYSPVITIIFQRCQFKYSSKFHMVQQRPVRSVRQTATGHWPRLRPYTSLAGYLTNDR